MWHYYLNAENCISEKWNWVSCNMGEVYNNEIQLDLMLLNEYYTNQNGKLLDIPPTIASNYLTKVSFLMLTTDLVIHWLTLYVLTQSNWYLCMEQKSIHTNINYSIRKKQKKERREEKRRKKHSHTNTNIHEWDIVKRRAEYLLFY